jgi:hypothetical protein
MTKLVYIGGYGHSGSTLLEYLMTASPKIIACGEVASSLRERLKKKQCTCGRPVEDCPIWGTLLASNERLDGWDHEQLTLALLDRVERDYAVMIDSSKTAWGHALAPFRLRRKLGSDFLLIHLVRDPRAVCWSAIKKTERRKARVNQALLYCSTTLGWSIANLACELFGRLYPGQYRRLRYEDLVRSPREVLGALFARKLPGLEWRGDDPGASDNRHQLYGNRMRGRPLKLDDVSEDRAWRTDMPLAYQRLVGPLSAILRPRYGYS